MTEDDQVQPLTTFALAEKTNPYELARLWGDRSKWLMAGFPRPREAGRLSDLEELAVMAALREWLDRWTPQQINKALLSGATLDQVAAAVGTAPTEVAGVWREWATGQRQLAETAPKVVGPDALAGMDQVERILAKHGHN